jgi:hypothetical protein
MVFSQKGAAATGSRAYKLIKTSFESEVGRGPKK